MINIGGVAVTPKDGFTIDRNKLEERDSGALSTFNTRKERFEPFDLVTIAGIDEQFVVQADNVIRLRDGLYEHQITLVEAISTFDGFYPADRIFSSDPPKTLGEILTVYKTELSKYHNLAITWDEEADWTDTTIRQKEFVGVNFGVIVADLFRTLDAKPRAKFIDNEWEIYPDFYNERRSLITPNPVSDLLAQDNLDYATRVKTQIKNGVYEQQEQRFFPSELGTIMPKSTTPQQADSRLEYTLDSGIIEITNAVAVDVSFIFNKSLTNQNYTDPFTVTVDISKHIVPKQVWDGLPTPADQITAGVHKKNALFYDIGGRSIKNLFIPESEQLFFGFSDNNRVLFNALIETAYEDNIFIPELNENIQDILAGRFRLAVDSDLEDIRMRFKYIPQRSLDVVHHRQYIKNMNEITQIHRQRDSQTEVERYKNVLKNLSNRMGNDIRQFSQIFPDGDTFDLGDYDISDNVIVRVKNTYYNDYVLCEYMMAEGFGNIDGEASLWKEPSPFEILGKDIKTNIIIEEFVEVSRESKAVSTRLKEAARTSVLATFDKTITPESPIRAAVMQPITDTATLVSASGVYLPAFTGGGGNTTSFHFQIDDPISAGRAFSDTFADPRFGLDLVYTEPDTSARFGELDDFFLFLIPDVDITDDGFYPLIPSADYNDIKDEALTETNIVDTINKDKNAKFAVTFQTHFVTDDPTIIIGSAIAKYNRLFTDKTIPNIQIYRSNKPYSIFDNKIRTGDLITTGGVSVNTTTRKLTVNANVLFQQPDYKYVALAYDNEILLAFNDYVAGDEFFINFTDAAEREIINQLPTPSSFGSQTFTDELRFALTNLSPESVTLEATLDGVTKTQVVQGNDGDPLNIANYTHTFSFDELDPNTPYQLSFRALPSAGSEFVASSFGIANATTDILPTDPPIAVEKVAAANGEGVVYTFTNPNDFGTQLFVRIDGYEAQSVTFNPNETKDVGVGFISENEVIQAGVEYDIDFRFRTTTFTNNWFSDYTVVRTLFVGQLDAPTYDAANSSATDSTVSFRWNNPNNVATQLRAELRTVPFTAEGGQTLVETKTVPIGANTGATVVFTNNINPLQFYSSTVKLLATGFRLESDEVFSTPAIQTTQATTVRPTMSLVSRTTSSLTIDFTNADGQTADIYYNTTGSPNVGDPTITGLGSGLTEQRTISGLASGAEVTVYARAKATNELISATRELLARTLLQQQQPNIATSPTASETQITVAYANPNSVSGNIRVRLNKLPTGGGKTFVEDKFLTIDGGGNNVANPFVFTGLDQNSNYELEAKFLADDYKLESTTRVTNVSTLQFKSQDPVVVINDITPTSVNFTMTNQDNRGAEFIYGVVFPLGQHPEATVGSFGSLTRGISSLASETPYILRVQAIADDYAPSDVVEIPFTTDPAPVPTQWVFRSATTPNETLNRGFVSGGCPTSANNLTYLNGQIDPSTKPFGYVVAVTSSSESGGFPIECTTHYYEAQ